MSTTRSTSTTGEPQGERVHSPLTRGCNRPAAPLRESTMQRETTAGRLLNRRSRYPDERLACGCLQPWQDEKIALHEFEGR